ncbi:GNAT family N-acetyltransferase [uncultured Chitinophaga sp.]|uniref:GNAT family N-acetyltransferase n=1 Tax=uncultured Chitinophaga sp. TaxID=339340 RepID=UPI0025E28FBE|nr:GNAT family N-acetyltransferase [uncultured Chitinophaga sp.]
MSEKVVTIRTELQHGDLGYVAYLHGIIYSKENGYGFNFERYVLEGLGEFAAQYASGKHRVWICEHNGKMVGFLMAFHRGDHAQLRYFILLPDYRSMGLGKKLMQGFMDYLQESGLKSAYLWTTKEQEAASGLYRRFGFELTEEKETESFDKTLTEQRFDLRLS